MPKKIALDLIMEEVMLIGYATVTKFFKIKMETAGSKLA